MKYRQAGFVFAPTPVDEAKGVTIQRVIGGERMAILDPFILLDHASIAAGSEVVGFNRHPHRGIETLSYVISGHVGHKDSIGNEGKVGPGGSQWMTAGNGIFHEEMLEPGPSGAEFLQLWFSLPRDRKRIPPAYVGAEAETIPEVRDNEATVRVVAGSFQGQQGPFQGIAVQPTILAIELGPGAKLEIPTPAGEATFSYLHRGSAASGGRKVFAPELIVYGEGDGVSLEGGAEGVSLLFVSAKPLGEPILQYRSFVMNTVDEIHETLEMIKAGTFGK